ncbi:hypothetical protein Aperf_G00000051257 [Anoplocephala perfoliata]
MTKEQINWSLLLLHSKQKDEQTRSAWRTFCEAHLENGVFPAGEKLGLADLIVAFVAHRFGMKFGSPVAHRWLETVLSYSLTGEFYVILECY